MKLLSNAFYTAAICCTAVSIHAEETTQVTIGQELYAEQYREYIDGHIVMQQRAPMIGFFSNVRIPFANNHHIGLSGRLAYGITHYKGQAEYDDQPAGKHDQFGSLTYSGTDRYVMQLGAEYGYTFDFAKLTPTVGIGYRRLTDRSDKLPEGGYRRVSNYYYASAGISAAFPVINRWELSPQLNYHYLIKGKQYSHLENQPGGMLAMNDQRHGHGIEMALALTHTFANNSNRLSVTPFYRYWHVGLSERFYTNASKTEGVIEPDNKTHELGIRVQYTF